ncbi:hypothetical protein BJ878DRAFT_488660 [Calycina marina]|uniref:Uncharacterized protein n=1 Tax=Calycina marina TaxID=1763456 RepID=A0A9P7ZA02_9HELO|nr:hypothetical protein BJ878DRAFT_488660 [Calycina marina]
MFSIQSGLVVLAAVSRASATIAQGWSLQSSSTQTSLHSCGNGAYCPISLNCDTEVGNNEVAACCSSTNDCRGDVEGAPVCSDSSWSMYLGYDGNGFCCETGLIGVYDISQSVAGTCVVSDNVGSLTTAELESTGTAAATSATLASSATLTTASAGTTTAGTSSTSSAVVVVSSSTTIPSSSGASATTKSTLSSTAVAVVASSTSGSSANSTSSAAASSTSTDSGTSVGVKTTAGFSLMAVAFIAIAML